MELEEVQAWIDAYVRAWASGDAAEIGSLFAEDARYFTHPFRPPWEGRDEIVRQWVEHPDDPESWQAEYQAVAVTGTTGVARGTTTYFHDDGSIRTEYANVYLIEFDGQGLAREFTEFFMERKPPARD
jgi:uncharacterized protein (TIGR02246 family)